MPIYASPWTLVTPQSSKGRCEAKERLMSGFHGLFIPGPTNMPFGVRQAMDIALEDQRAPDFREAAGASASRLAACAKT
jgi:aspartate aminotransferase-like enzyme